MTEAEVEARLAAADGVLGAAGHAVTDPVTREIVRRKIRGEITGEEADRLILAHCGVTPRE
ncbi:antitoxin VbhA family protein [Leucobacter tenebrionis]|nr:antitoxin VbhA family protein [Leucobacter tenebrionis]